MENLWQNFFRTREALERFQTNKFFYQGSSPEDEAILLEKGFVRPITTCALTINAGPVDINHYAWTRKGKIAYNLTHPVYFVVDSALSLAFGN